MAATAMDSAALSIISTYPSASPKLNKSINSLRFQISISAPALSLKLPLLHSIRKPVFQFQSSLGSVTVEQEQELEQGQGQGQGQGQEEVGKPQKVESRRKLYVLNLPWSYSVVDIKKLFGECGTVSDVEIIKQKDGNNRGFAFVTMASGEEAQAAIEKFDSYEVAGRIIRVQFSKRFKRPRAGPAVTPPPGETRHKLYVSNLGWKVRSNNLRELFSAEFNPVSARVVFDGPSGRSAGYGFVSFATKEEAQSALSALDGKELLGRPIRLQFSEKNVDASHNQGEENSSQQEVPQNKDEESSPQPPEES